MIPFTSSVSMSRHDATHTDANPSSSSSSSGTEVGDKNILGTRLELCGAQPVTGFFRDGYCRTGPHDRGIHVVCSEVNSEFLEYTKAQGNDLSTPKPGFGFPGLEPGDKWCLCAARWREAFKKGKAPPVDLKATHSKATTIVPLKEFNEVNESL